MTNRYRTGISKNRVLIIIWLTLVFYISFVLYSDVNKFVKHFSQINLQFLLPILLTFTASIFVKSIRQLILLRGIGINLEFKENLVLYLSGLSLIVTPLGLGQMIKSFFLFKRYDQPVSKTVPIVIFERYHDLLSLFCFMIILSFIGNFKILQLAIIISGVLLLLGFILIKRVNIIQSLKEKLSRVKFLASLKVSSSEFSNSMYLLSSNKNLFASWVVSMPAWFLEAIGIFLCFQSFNLNYDFVFTTAFGFSSIFFGAISFIPAGTGITEVIFVQLLSSRGLELSLATAVVIFYRLCSIWYSTLIGVVVANHLLKDRVKYNP